jgi:hypothetical protein
MAHDLKEHLDMQGVAGYEMLEDIQKTVWGRSDEVDSYLRNLVTREEGLFETREETRKWVRKIFHFMKMTALRVETFCTVDYSKPCPCCGDTMTEALYIQFADELKKMNEITTSIMTEYTLNALCNMLSTEEHPVSVRESAKALVEIQWQEAYN